MKFSNSFFPLILHDFLLYNIHDVFCQKQFAVNRSINVNMKICCISLKIPLTINHNVLMYIKSRICFYNKLIKSKTCNMCMWHFKNLPMQYTCTVIFSPVKIENFQGIIFDIFSSPEPKAQGELIG